MHFHPDRKIKFDKKIIIIDNKYTLIINQSSHITLEKYDFPLGYNIIKPANKVIIDFEGNLEQLFKF